MTQVLELRSVSRVYDERHSSYHALHDASLTIDHGESVAVVGSSGSGKTTLLRIMGCLDFPTTGIVLIEGRDTRSIAKRELALFRCLHMGFVFQHQTVVPRLTALDNVMIPGMVLGRPKRELMDKAHELLGLVGLSHRVAARGSRLSGGEQQRVAIARALINDQNIILADEPTGELDVENSAAVMEILMNINKFVGSTVVYVTHNQKLARYAGRLITIRDGHVVGDFIG